MSTIPSKIFIQVETPKEQEVNILFIVFLLAMFTCISYYCQLFYRKVWKTLKTIKKTANEKENVIGR